MINITAQKITEFFEKDTFETDAWRSEKLVVGIDEAGRGCLAGPVVAGAAVLHPHVKHPLLRDSKLLTPAQLDDAYEWICKNSWFAAASSSHRIIDSLNIYRATQCTMQKALTNLLAILPSIPQSILVDAMPLESPIEVPLFYFTKGESKSCSIAAASIVAKVTRDRMIKKLDRSFPAFTLENHKGYATAEHRAALMVYGPSFIHRKSFELFQEPDNGQQTLFC
ncbi:MAG: ribonuclease HII [candidate division TM6 bacterium GW2011_GWF2_43_87]|nr:MAG: ribonuclease HII [candidate division TM6 bacterium GW2011_GWF2_43_87]